MDRISFFNSDEEVIPGFQTIHTPGHRPESVSFYEPESGAFISGDFIIVMKGKIVVNTFVYDSKAQMESLEKVKKLENLIYLLPGHGNCMDFNENLLRYDPKAAD
jgi:glyoxylase-like metal-dependent hydrolase (beta-lactamase superfamily II)